MAGEFERELAQFVEFETSADEWISDIPGMKPERKPWRPKEPEEQRLTRDCLREARDEIEILRNVAMLHISYDRHSAALSLHKRIKEICIAAKKLIDCKDSETPKMRHELRSLLSCD
jgi:hypothetical protein